MSEDPTALARIPARLPNIEVRCPVQYSTTYVRWHLSHDPADVSTGARCVHTVQYCMVETGGAEQCRSACPAPRRRAALEQQTEVWNCGLWRP